MNNTKIEPAFEGNDTCIVFCSDNGFIPCTSVAIQSIIEHALPEQLYDIVILHSRMDQTNQNMIEKMADGFENVSIRCRNIERITSGHRFFTANRDAFTEEAYYRLFIPWVLGKSYTKALYLDGDMLIRHDISRIFDIESENTLIAAVRDYWGICNCYIPGDPRRSYRKKIGIREMDDYVISATILFDLQRFRNEYQVNEVVNLIESRKWEQHDQDVINLLCMGKICYLSPVWGYMGEHGNEIYLPQHLLADLEEAKNDPVIIHFGGGKKPWTNTALSDDKDFEFWEMADKTPFLSQLVDNISSHVYKNSLLRYLARGEFDKYEANSGTAYLHKHIELGGYSTEYRKISIHDEVLRLEGTVFVFRASKESNIEVRIKVNNELISPLWCKREDEYHKERDFLMYRGESFCFDIPLNRNIGKHILEITCMVDGAFCSGNSTTFGRFFPISEDYSSAYYEEDKWILTSNDSKLELVLSRLPDRMTHEMKYLKELLSNGRRKAVLVRAFYHVFRNFVRKPIWLVSDRQMIADDNGKAFFQFINEKHRREVSSFFVISKDCPDYKKMKRYGKVLSPDSWMHKIVALFASVNVSSQTDEVFRAPLGFYNPSFRDIGCKAKFVFLTHGVSLSDASGWLGRRNMQFDGLVASAFSEYDSIINGAYGYSSDEVWLTGIPRFDLLEDHAEKLITIMPTWRLYLSIGQNHTTGNWTTSSGLAESKYAEFYRAILQHPELSQRATELGYKIQFRMHPAFRSQAEKFALPSNANLVDNSISYNEIYAKSSLIVTDYSSSVVDFVYLRKPIIYCQFDKDEFFDGKHIYIKGYFDYERNGFGEVEYDLEHTVDRIIEYMENGCQLKDKYRERIDNFFAYNDKSNCQRVYDRIMALEGE